MANEAQRGGARGQSRRGTTRSAPRTDVVDKTPLAGESDAVGGAPSAGEADAAGATASAGARKPSGETKATARRESASAREPAAGSEPAGGSEPGDGTTAADGERAAALRRRRVAALGTYRAKRMAAAETLRESVRADYEAGLVSLSELGRSVGRTPGTLRRWAREGGWSEPARRVGRAAPALRASARHRLVGRLFAAFAHQVGDVEARAGAARADGGAPAEADIKVVAALARTLEVLIDLDRRTRDEADAADAPTSGATSRQSTEAASEGMDVDALREELARRLDRLRRAHRAGLPGEAGTA